MNAWIMSHARARTHARARARARTHTHTHVHAFMRTGLSRGSPDHSTWAGPWSEYAVNFLVKDCLAKELSSAFRNEDFQARLWPPYLVYARKHAHTHTQTNRNTSPVVYACASTCVCVLICVCVCICFLTPTLAHTGFARAGTF